MSGNLVAGVFSGSVAVFASRNRAAIPVPFPERGAEAEGFAIPKPRPCSSCAASRHGLSLTRHGAAEKGGGTPLSAICQGVPPYRPVEPPALPSGVHGAFYSRETGCRSVHGPCPALRVTIHPRPARARNE